MYSENHLRVYGNCITGNEEEHHQEMEARIEEGVVYSPYPGGAVPNISVYEAIKACLERGGKKTALVCADQQVTSSELLRMLQRYAAGFQRHGVKPGDKVLAHLGDSVENFIALYAIIIAGGVAILSDPASDKDEAIQKLRDGKASHVLTTQEEAHLFCKTCSGWTYQDIFWFLRRTRICFRIELQIYEGGGVCRGSGH